MNRENVWSINYRSVTVKMMDGSVVTGKINIGDNNRLSEVLKTSHDHFITVVSKGRDGDSEKILILNKENIVWIEPDDSVEGYEKTLQVVSRF